MKRNRIVIDLNASGQRGAGRRGMFSSRRGGAAKPLMIIALVLVVLGGAVLTGGYLWWRHYQSSPAYSLALLADAAQRNDAETIDNILDTDKITDDFVSQIRQSTSGSYSSAISSLLPAQVNSLAASASPKLKQTVHEQVVIELKRLTEAAAGKPLIVVALAVPYFADIKKENEVARALLNIKDERVQLTMQASDERWRITAIQNQRLERAIADGIARSLPASSLQLQEEIRKRLPNRTR